MKVLHVLDHSTPVTDGYSVRSQSIVQFQRDLGLDPVVLTSARHEDRYHAEVKAASEVIDGVTYYRTRPQRERALPLIPEFQRLRRMTARLRAVVDQEQPTLLHAHSPCLWGLATSRVARRTGLPFVYEIRGFWEDALVDLGKTTERSARYRLVRAVEGKVCRTADAVTTIAEGLRDDLIRRGLSADKIFLVPNGVDIERFQQPSRDEQLLEELGLRGKPLIGYIGSLFAWEGVEDLVRAALVLKDRAPNTRIVIVGGGDRQPAIEQLVGDLGVTDCVRLVGRVPHEEIIRYYSILDVLVYPRVSTRNTELCTPLKPLEAMAMGKAIVGSSVGGIRELLAAGTGLEYQAGDPLELAERCLELLADDEQRASCGRLARQHVANERSWKALATRYLDVYDVACGKRSRCRSTPAGKNSFEHASN